MLIDEYLPKYDVSNKYAVTVDAPPERVIEVVHRLDISSAEISMLLFRLRGLARCESGENYDIDRIQKAGFVILGEDPSQEFLLGLIGKPWSPTVYSLGWSSRKRPGSFGSWGSLGTTGPPSSSRCWRAAKWTCC